MTLRNNVCDLTVTENTARFEPVTPYSDALPSCPDTLEHYENNKRWAYHTLLLMLPQIVTYLHPVRLIINQKRAIMFHHFPGVLVMNIWHTCRYAENP